MNGTGTLQGIASYFYSYRCTLRAWSLPHFSQFTDATKNPLRQQAQSLSPEILDMCVGCQNRNAFYSASEELP